MHIIVFNEYYPNPFKPSLTTEIEQFLNDNHKLTLFAMGGYWNPIDPKVRELGLDRLIRYLPTTLNSLPRFLGSSTKALLRNPLGRISAATRIIRSSSSFKRNLINIFRMLQLPLSSPDLCLVHNLNTMRSLTFLRSLYPGVPVALYYHGGELPGMSIISNDIAASAFDSANVVFTNTENSKSQAISRGCPPHKIFAIPVGFNISEFKPPKQRQYYRQKQLRLLSIGRFSVEKGLIYALNGLVQLIDQGITQWQYRLIGNGPQEAELKDFVKNNNNHRQSAFSGIIVQERGSFRAGASRCITSSQHLYRCLSGISGLCSTGGNANEDSGSYYTNRWSTRIDRTPDAAFLPAGTRLFSNCRVYKRADVA